MSVHVSSQSLFDRSVGRSSIAAPLRVAVVILAVLLTALAAQFTTPVPFTAVPFTFTPVAVLVTGAVLGSRLGAVSQVLYVLAGVLGLGVFSPSATLPPGMLRVIGPTGGYLMAYPLAAFVTGWLSEQGWDRRYWTSLAAMCAGLATIYVGGVAWLTVAFVHSFAAAVTSGLWPFVGLDLLKVTAAAMILPQAWRLVGRRLD